MAFRWEQQHFDAGARLFADGFLIGQVAQYSRCRMCDPSHEHPRSAYYQGFLRGVRATGDFDTIGEAQRALEVAATSI